MAAVVSNSTDGSLRPALLLETVLNGSEIITSHSERTFSSDVKRFFLPSKTSGTGSTKCTSRVAAHNASIC